MGYTPGDVDDMSLWQFAACGEGFRKAHSPEPPPPPPSEEVFERMLNRYNQMTKH